jgi:hypothetical protein
MKTIPNFKIRASASGKLATNPRSKNELLSETTKSYLKEWATEQIFGIKNEIKSKYLERGLQEEDNAIDFAIQVLDLPMVLKNEKTFENEYFTGTPDLIIDDTVLDIKCSWSAFSFPFFEEEIPNNDYKCQVNVYMNLLGLKKAKVVYVLLDNELINHKYDIDNSLRVKVFNFEYDEELIKNLEKKVLYSRDYLKNIL